MDQDEKILENKKFFYHKFLDLHFCNRIIFFILSCLISSALISHGGHFSLFLQNVKVPFFTIVFFSLLIKLLPFNLGSFSEFSEILKFKPISFATISFLFKSKYAISKSNVFLFLSKTFALFNLITLFLIEYSNSLTL